jgi:hypothetical protein
MPKPNGVEPSEHCMWAVEWGAYVQWNKDIEKSTWERAPSPSKLGPSPSKLAPPPSSLKVECDTLAEFSNRFLSKQNKFTRLSFPNLKLDLSLEEYHDMFDMMGLAKEHRAEAFRLLEQKRNTLPSNSMDTS